MTDFLSKTAKTLFGGHLEFRVRLFNIMAAGGAGTGLSICREVARMHGGEITVHSIPSAGTRITVVLNGIKKGGGNG
ncbi:MAG: ATP-binding protein [Chitinispirillia bacterium]|nr:ATP-binding protein [Chitinispirillia bacterium]MCL2268327.1 ATP-binding protein [Chitinispirillia bacterium]